MTTETLDQIARRNTFVLAFAQATNYAVAPLSMAIGGLAGHYLLGTDKTLATLPITCFVLGPFLASMPAALLMRKIGRRFGFMTGSAIGFLGCALAVFAILKGNFPLLCIAMSVIGFSIGFTQQYRFAAADFGSDAVKTRAISYVMAGGLLAAIVGPQTAMFFSNLFDPVLFAGSFVGGMILCAAGFFTLIMLAEPREVLERQEDEVGKPGYERRLSEIVRQPTFIVAVVCGAASYMMMSLVMTAAPLAMIICGYSSDMATLGIQWHVMAMYAPSFFTGSLIIRFGHRAVIGTGFALYVICGIIALAGIEIANFWAALAVLGVAWNFGYIGATSLVTKAYRPNEKNKVQGLFDTLIFALVASVSLLSGVLMANFGWTAVLLLMIPPLSIATLVLLGAKRFTGAPQAI